MDEKGSWGSAQGADMLEGRGAGQASWAQELHPVSQEQSGDTGKASAGGDGRGLVEKQGSFTSVAKCHSCNDFSSSACLPAVMQ